MPKICLFDASGYIHRAFHALPTLSNSKGELVHAVYGFSRMVSKILKEDAPDYVAICFDTPSPTFRHERYANYKATRLEADKGLVSQIPLAEELAKAWGLACIKMPGFEADDVIATLAHRARQERWDVLILSGDKDILQLVQEGVVVRDEIKKVDYDALKVKERYGVSPEQLVDMFCLMGDKVDNIAGVPGVGEKTASKLIAQHGSLEELFKRLNGAQPALKEKLVQFKDNVFANRHLLTLDRQVPLKEDLESLKVRPTDPVAFPALMKRLEFRGTLHGAGGVNFETTLDVNKTREVPVVLTEDQLALLERKLSQAKEVAYDVETDDLNQHRCALVGVSLSVKADEGWYIPVGHRTLETQKQLPWEKVRAVLGPILANNNVLKCGHNIKFDNTVLERYGINVQGPSFDTMIAAYCLDPSRSNYGLKDLAADFLNERMTRFEELMGKGKAASMAEVPITDAARYAGADAEVTFRLYQLFEPRLKEENLWPLFDGLEMPLVKVIQQMERTGVAVDIAYLSDLRKIFEKSLLALESEIHQLAGEPFLINSSKQLSHILFEKLKLPVVKKTKTGYSTDEEVLSKLACRHPICEKIIAYRELAKLSSTYVESLLKMADPDTSRVHTSFHQTGTITGRLSSSEPNLQNIPVRTEQGRQIRRAFVAQKGRVLISADYSQIDLRVLAHLSQDPILVKTFKDGGDVHTLTASEVFHVDPKDVTGDMRRRAKAINFGIVYGQQAYGLSQTLGIPVEEASSFIDHYFLRYKGVQAWITATLAKARETGVVSTLAGRRRRVPDINSPSASARGFAERVAMNTPIQGSSADIIKAAMIQLLEKFKSRGFKTQMIVQVHDDLLFEAPENEINAVLPVIRQGMETSYQLTVPLVVDIKMGSNWNDIKKIPAEKVQ